MVKRITRGSRSRGYSENNKSDDDTQVTVTDKNKRRRKYTKEDGTIWVDDDTLNPEDDDKHVLLLEIDDDSSSDYEPDEEEEEESDEEEFIQYLIEKYVVPDGNKAFTPSVKKSDGRKKKTEVIPIKLSKTEEAFYKGQSAAKKTELFELMTRVSSLVIDEGEIPYKFRVLQLPISDYVKSSVIKKITVLNEMDGESGEGHKLRSWVDAFMRIPFGKTVPLPVQIKDGTEKCSTFMMEARKKMDRHIYGMENAKLQIMQIMAQWVVNPTSIGNVIALAGPPGIGKTSLARNAIAEVLERPFEFFTLGGASDISNFIGHSYTYEGSMWGRIVDSLMHAGTMNPVLYFDELDKISTTPHGEEIANMMIHMTDRSQNTQFHDRYFAGVDFDLSQCLFVFSFNDIERVHPILRDRMNIIQCGGYNEKDKMIILKDYIFPQILERLQFTKSDITLTDSAVKYMISEFSKEEKGVRTLIRTVESMMTRLNMLRVSNYESMKDYKFYMEVKFPLTLTEENTKILLSELDKKEPELWRSLYN